MPKFGFFDAVERKYGGSPGMEQQSRGQKNKMKKFERTHPAE